MGPSFELLEKFIDRFLTSFLVIGSSEIWHRARKTSDQIREASNIKNN